MIKFSMKPQRNEAWKPPPVLQTSDADATPDFSFDVNPSCTYWLSLRTFDPKYWSKITDYVYAAQDRMICPYLTAEIRQNATDADGTASLEAMHRMASSAAMAVYNRYKLRENLMPATSYNGERSWAAEDRADMKHYGLLMAGVEYSFWVIEAKAKYFGGTTAGWEGCSARRLARGRLDIEPQAKIFAEWLNEIHRWGLTVHAPEVQYDINVCIGLLNAVRPEKKRKREGVSGAYDDGGPQRHRVPDDHQHGF